MNNDNNINENIPREQPSENIPEAEAPAVAAPIPETPCEAAPEAPQQLPPQPAGYYPPQAPAYDPSYAPNYDPRYTRPYQPPVSPYGQPNYNPNYGQPYNPAPPQPPVNNYPPQGNYPPVYPQPYPVAAPQKPKLSGGVKAFIITMVVLAVAGFGAFGVAIALYGGNTTTPPSSEESSHDYNGPRYEDFFGNNPYGDFYGDFYGDYFDGGDSSGSESSSDEALKIEEKDQPDIKIPEVKEGIVINKKPFSSELSAEEVYAKVLPSTVTVDVDIHYTNGQTEDSTGTGIFISEDGFVITNSHVVANSKSVSVKVITSDGKEYPAVVVGLDKTTDLAILKVDGSGFTPAEFGSADELSIGEWVIAIGNPGGTEFTGSLTRGVISGLDRLVGSYSSNGMTYIQTDAAINPGNSGGPLVNMYGQVIGINSSKIVADYYEGMGFAIPVSDAKGIIDQLLMKGYVQGRVRLGITGQNVQYGSPLGVTIVAIDEVSSFAGTDAKVGDVITAIGGVKVESLTNLSNEFLKFAPGDKVEVELYRPNTGRTFTITITLLEDKGETQR